MTKEELDNKRLYAEGITASQLFKEVSLLKKELIYMKALTKHHIEANIAMQASNETLRSIIENLKPGFFDDPS